MELQNIDHKFHIWKMFPKVAVTIFTFVLYSENETAKYRSQISHLGNVPQNTRPTHLVFARH